VSARFEPFLKGTFTLPSLGGGRRSSLASPNHLNLLSSVFCFQLSIFVCGCFSEIRSVCVIVPGIRSDPFQRFCGLLYLVLCTLFTNF
jgi:hypothetical protein